MLVLRETEICHILSVVSEYLDILYLYSLYVLIFYLVYLYIFIHSILISFTRTYFHVFHFLFVRNIVYVSRVPPTRSVIRVSAGRADEGKS